MESLTGLELSVSIPRFLVTRGLGGLTGAAVYGALSGLRKVQLRRSPLPGCVV